jgi:D-3-phosphoglycerate dehydrogenase
MKVLINRPIHPTALAKLEEHATVVTAFTASTSELTEMLPQMDALLLCAGYSIGAQEMTKAPRLCVIGRHGVGLDNVDVQAATEHGIPLVYTPYGPTESTAEHAFALLLAVARRLPVLDRETRAGNFGIRNQLASRGQELKGKVLGIVGFGRIGQRLAEMCRQAFDMKVLVYDPYLDAETVQGLNATLVPDLCDLARRVDILSIHIPATPETHHLIDGKVIQAMRERAILINAARGTVLDQAALVQALQEERIYGAGIDVYDPEPPSDDNPLFTLDRVVLSPHVASNTEEGRLLMGTTVVQDIIAVLEGNRPQYLANPTVWKNRRRSSAPNLQGEERKIQ